MGDDGQHFFVVRSGEFGVYLKQVGDTPMHKYKPGGSFGELALLYNKPRAATIKCRSVGVLYQLDRNTFRGVLIAGQRTAVDSPSPPSPPPSPPLSPPLESQRGVYSRMSIVVACVLTVIEYSVLQCDNSKNEEVITYDIILSITKPYEIILYAAISCV